MGALHTFPGIAPMPAVARILSRYDRGKVEAFIEVAIGLLDTLDGDPDAEPDGTEDDSDGDERGDQGWPEWHTLPAASRRAAHASLGAVNGWGPAHEDDEDDDPSGQCDEDGVNTDLWALVDKGAGCPISDPGGMRE